MKYLFSKVALSPEDELQEKCYEWYGCITHNHDWKLETKLYPLYILLFL